MLTLILVLMMIEEASSRCGCNRAFDQGSHAGMNNEVPVAGDIFKTSSTTSANSNDPSYKHIVPNYKVLQFHPTYLDFRDQAVGIAALKVVSLTNPSHDSSISLLSITGDVEPFYSRFHTKVISPLGSTSIEIVFLARAAGNVERTVYVQTNRGAFPYQLFGTGMANQYKLRSYVGAKIPLGGNFSPYINMYNPYGEMIKLTEMFSSGGFLHLELPAAATHTSQMMWEIPAYETKPVIKATFKGSIVGNHTGYIRIKAKPPVPKEQNIILPFQIQVSSDHGLYTNVDVFDFGTLRTMDEPKILNLHLMNYGNKSLHILSVTVEPPNKAISVVFSPTTLKASKKYSKLASISYSALHTTSRRQHNGKIVVAYGPKGSRKLEIGYSAQVLQGTLAYSVGKTAFYAPDAVASPMLQPLTITNTFSFPLIIHNASLPKEVDNLFTITSFSSPVTVSPQKLVSPLSLKFQANSSELALSTMLRLYTNASIFTIPIHSYNGKMKYEVGSVNEQALDYGTIGVGENRSLYFKIINNNPIEVSIREYSCSVDAEFVRLRLVDIKHTKKSRSGRRSKHSQGRNSTAQNQTDSASQITLRPSDIANFVLDVSAPPVEGTYTGEVKLKTAYEEIKIPVYLKTVIGSLISRPRRITFEQSFPGQSKNFALHLESSFSNPIHLTEVTLYPPDPRFTFQWPSEGVPALQPNVKTRIGWMQFDPMLGSDLQCYLCLCKSEKDCLDWMNTLVLPSDTWEFDLRLLEKIKNKWETLKENHEIRINSSILVNSEIIKSYSIPVQASLSWPSVVEQSIYFAPTYVGNVSFQKLVLNNPADVPVLVQILPIVNYPHPPGGLDLVSDRLEIDSFSIELSGHHAFFLPDLDKEFKWDSKALLKSKFGIEASSKTVNLLLKRRSKEVVTVGFRPDDEIMKTSIIVVRNNLTVLDLVVVQGKGARGEFTINNKKPGLGSLLLFEMKDSHLMDCHRATPKARTYPSFTVKRSFSVTNPGQLPVHVTSFKVNGMECGGYGFGVLNCEPFVLLPNSSRKLDITFTPDFTSSRVSRILQVHTTMEPVLEFTLLATLPHHLLPLCAAALPKPVWEPYLHVVAAVTMTVVFIVVIFMAYLDAQKYVIHCSFGSSRNSPIRIGRVTDIYSPRAIFDMKAVSKNKVKVDKEPSSNGVAGCVKEDNHTKRGVDMADSLWTPSRSRSSSSSSIAADAQGKSTPVKTHSPIVKQDSNRKEQSDTDISVAGAKKYGKKKAGKQSSVESDDKGRVLTEKKKRKTIEKFKDGKAAQTSVEKEAEVESKPRDDVDLQSNSGHSCNESPSEEERSVTQEQLARKPKRKVKRSARREDSEEKAVGATVVTTSLTCSAEDSDKKTTSFTVADSKASRSQVKGSGCRIESSGPPSPSDSGSNSIDKLDDISIAGPKPEVHRESTGKSKQDSGHGKHRHRNDTSKKKNQQNSHRNGDPPNSLHDIADHVVAAALEKSLASKNKRQESKAKSEKSQSGSGPSTPTSLSGSSRSSSYSSIVSESAGQGKVTLNPAPGCPPHQDTVPSPQGSSKTWNVAESFRGFMPGSANRRNSDDSSIGLPWRKLVPKLHQDFDLAKLPSSEHSGNNNSMFYYDNLSSLRATKVPLKEGSELWGKAPGTRLPRQDNSLTPVIKSDLNPESSEFVPSPMRDSIALRSVRRNKAVGAGPAFDARRPPPGFTRSKHQGNVWNNEELLLSDSAPDRHAWSNGSYGVSHLLPAFNDEERFSPLIGSRREGAGIGPYDDNFGSFGTSAPISSVTERESMWSSGSFQPPQKDLSWSTPTITPSIWSSAAVTSSKSSLSPSLSGLDLRFPAYSEDAKDELSDENPIDQLESLWKAGDNNLGIPYEGWCDDIKEKFD